MKRVALYARATTDEALFRQMEELRHYLEEHPDWEVALEARDIGVSGDKCERYGLLKVIDGIEANKIDIVLSASMSRFYRNPDLAHEVLTEIKKHGAEVVCIDGSENAPFETLETLSLEGIDIEFEDAENEEAQADAAILWPSML